jgi:hypothetical protein
VITRETSATNATGAETATETAVAEFMRRRGITRCPTACLLPTQGSVPPQDRVALAEHAEARERRRQARAARQNGFLPSLLPRFSR